MACISILEIALRVLLTYACSHHCYICCLTLQWHESIDAPCPQMKRCIEIAQRCVDTDPHKRPTAGEIIDYLKETEIIIEKDLPTIDEPPRKKKPIYEPRNDPGSSLHQVGMIDISFEAKQPC